MFTKYSPKSTDCSPGIAFRKLERSFGLNCDWRLTEIICCIQRSVVAHRQIMGSRSWVYFGRRRLISIPFSPCNRKKLSQLLICQLLSESKGIISRSGAREMRNFKTMLPRSRWSCNAIHWRHLNQFKTPFTHIRLLFVSCFAIRRFLVNKLYLIVTQSTELLSLFK